MWKILKKLKRDRILAFFGLYPKSSKSKNDRNTYRSRLVTELCKILRQGVLFPCSSFSPSIYSLNGKIFITFVPLKLLLKPDLFQFLCMCTYVPMCGCPWRSEEGGRSPGAGFKVNASCQTWSQESNFYPQEEQQAF